MWKKKDVKKIRGRAFLWSAIVLLALICQCFIRLHQSAFFRYTSFNCLLAVRVRIIIQLAKILWSRNNETFYSFWFYFCGFIGFETTKVWSPLGKKIILFVREKSMFSIWQSMFSKDPVFGIHMDILTNIRLSEKNIQLEPLW